MTPLYGRSSDNIPLANALECAKILPEAVALLYSPQSCQFAKVEPNGSLIDCKGETIDLQSIFEVRAFNSTYELRWLNQHNGLGKAVLISEQEISTSYLEDIIEPLFALDTIPQKYLLWGKGINKSTDSSWGVLATARIGALPVPIGGVTDGDRVYLNACEYLQVVDEYGNVAVVEERLMNLNLEMQ